MNEEPTFRNVADRLGATLVESEQLLGGSSAIVHALTIEMASGDVDRVVLRQHRSNNFKNHRGTVAAKEFHVLHRLHEQGFAVPAPQLVDQSEGWLVTDWVAGSSEVPPALLDGALEQMARFLSELHQLDLAQLDEGVVDKLEDPIAALATYLPSSEYGEALRTALSLQAISFEPNPPCLIHGDYWPGNLLWHNATLAAVIDWEDAQLGDPLADLASARVELLCQYGPEAMEDFTVRYVEITNPDTTFLPVWEVYVSSSALATMHLWGLATVEEQRRRAITTEFFERAMVDVFASCDNRFAMGRRLGPHRPDYR